MGFGSDPMNDKDVQVGFYESPDKLVKDGNGDVARDYSFTIRPSAKFEGLFSAKTIKGQIVSTKAVCQVFGHFAKLLYFGDIIDQAAATILLESFLALRGPNLLPDPNPDPNSV